MSTATLQAVPSVRDKVSKEEWQIRTDLAATYRLVAQDLDARSLRLSDGESFVMRLRLKQAEA